MISIRPFLQSMHKYDDKVMAADWFVVPSAVKFESTYSIAGFHMSADLGPHPLCMGPGL